MAEEEWDGITEKHKALPTEGLSCAFLFIRFVEIQLLLCWFYDIFFIKSICLEGGI